MDKRELLSNMEIVLEKDIDDTKHDQPVYKLNQEGKNIIFNYPHSDTLIDIFSNIQNQIDLKNEFIEKLKKSVRLDETIYYGDAHPHRCASKSSISFYTLLRLGFSDEAIISLKSRKDSSEAIMRMLNVLLKESARYFDVNQLNEIRTIVSIMNIEEGYQYSVRYGFKINKSATISRILEESYRLLKKA